MQTLLRDLKLAILLIKLLALLLPLAQLVFSLRKLLFERLDRAHVGLLLVFEVHNALSNLPEFSLQTLVAIGCVVELGLRLLGALEGALQLRMNVVNFFLKLFDLGHSFLF